MPLLRFQLYLKICNHFARSTLDGINIIKELFERGVRVCVLNMGLVENTPIGRLNFGVILDFAEFEHDVVVVRKQSQS